MPVYHQNTFTLITERVAPVTDEPCRPMTSKQVKKAHKAANKGPKLSRAEQRKIELAEQERIRKELEKDRQANRARLAREKKKAKEDQEKQERRRKGKPLVDVRPSQDLIARFVKGGWGKKKDADQGESPKLTSVSEEQLEEEGDLEAPRENSLGDRSGEPAAHHESEPEPQEPGARVPEITESEPPTDPDPNASAREKRTRAASESQHSEAHARSAPKHTQQGSSTRTERRRTQPNAPDPAPGSSPVPSNRSIQHEYTEDLPATSSKPAIAAPLSQAIWDDELDDDLLQQLGATQKVVVSEQSSSGFSKPSHPRSSQKTSSAGISQAKSHSRPPPTAVTNEKGIDGLDDVLAGIGTQAVGLWEEEESEFMASQYPKASPWKSNRDTPTPAAGLLASKNTALDDDQAAVATDSVFEQDTSRKPALPQSTETRQSLASNRRAQGQPDAPAPRASGLRRQLSRQLSGFSEDGLDDDALLEIGTQPLEKSTTRHIPSIATHSKQQPMAAPPRPSTMGGPPRPAENGHRPSFHQPNVGFDKPMAPPPVPQPPPLSTQAVLSSLGDYFPSPSQQERELDDDLGEFLKSQPTPCPPPKRPRQPPSASPVEPPRSQKRFFSASGSNERISLAIHRSNRDAAMHELRKKEQQRVEAGKAQAKLQAKQQGRQFVAQPPNTLGPVNNQARAPRPAGKPPTLVINETFEPPAKRQKTTTRTKSQVRPPVFKQPSIKPTGPHKPPAFKSTTRTTVPAADKENCRQTAAAPTTSQGSDYGGDWIDDMNVSATQIISDGSNSRYVR